MSSSYSEHLFEDFKRYFPSSSMGIVDYEVISPDRIMMYSNDGGIMVYNGIEHSCRNYAAGADLTDEKVWRRRFRDCLDDILYERGISQRELAERCGISQASITKYMKCLSTPSAYVMRQIARALNCSVDYLETYCK